MAADTSYGKWLAVNLNRAPPGELPGGFTFQRGIISRVSFQTTVASTALCLSGGGFRALHWHLGSLRALNERGLLACIDTISGVSAGALGAAWLGLQWDQLAFDTAGVASRLDELVLAPLSAFMQHRVGIAPSLLSFLPLRGLPSRMLASELDQLLFRGARLGDMSRQLRVLLNAVDLATAEPVVLAREGVVHGHYGRLPLDDLPVAQAVAASCAFPPYFAPAILPLTGAARSAAWSGPAHLQLADSVLHDVMGLDQVWDSHERVFVSDASLPRKFASPIAASWLSVLLHGQRSQFHHARLLRLARLEESFVRGLRQGAYWGLGGVALPLRNTVSHEQGASLENLWKTQAFLLRLPQAIQTQLETGARDLAHQALESHLLASSNN